MRPTFSFFLILIVPFAIKAEEIWQPVNLLRLHHAICRIHSNSAGEINLGTGVVIAKQGASYKILTNAHVVGDEGSSEIKVVFWYEGHQLPARSAVIEWKSYAPGTARDIAILDLADASCRDFPPAVIPLESPDSQLLPGQGFHSIGCPHGGWPTAFTGHITRNLRAAIEFLPPPAEGRSGSPLFELTTGKIIGLIAWQTADQRSGRALSLLEIHAAFAGNPPGLLQASSRGSQHKECFLDLFQVNRPTVNLVGELQPLVPVQQCPGICPPRDPLQPKPSQPRWLPWSGRHQLPPSIEQPPSIQMPSPPEPQPLEPALPAQPPALTEKEKGSDTQPLEIELESTTNFEIPWGFLLLTALSGIGVGSSLPPLTRWIGAKITGRIADTVGQRIQHRWREQRRPRTSRAPPRMEKAEETVTTSSPVPLKETQVVRTQHEYVGYETKNRELKAYQQALKDLVQHYPGSADWVRAVESYKEQILAGSFQEKV
ncbi:Hypothetical protein PBC10988_27570 [Planctomycetales bacterium 10988]|nr:Hypothetical protein PBC10988_27570 [Planctomycetales bacterium 10988]